MPPTWVLTDTEAMASTLPRAWMFTGTVFFTACATVTGTGRAAFGPALSLSPLQETAARAATRTITARAMRNAGAGQKTTREKRARITTRFLQFFFGC
jgi:hypothetical protein